MKQLAIAAGAALVLLGSAQAQQMGMPPMTMSAVYGELGYTFLKIDAAETSLRPDAIRGILGYEVHPMLAIEVMAAGGINDDDKDVVIGGIPGSVQAKMDYMYGIWVKPKWWA